MPTYEIVLIVHHGLLSHELAGLIQESKVFLEQRGARILKMEDWGTRELEYLIKKSSRGRYYYFCVNSDTKCVSEFYKKTAYDENILRRFIRKIEEAEVTPGDTMMLQRDVAATENNSDAAA